MTLKKINLTQFVLSFNYLLTRFLVPSCNESENMVLYSWFASTPSHVPEYAPAKFGSGGLAVLPRGPPKPPNIAQARPIFKRGTVLCCWAERNSRRVSLFRGREQPLFIYNLCRPYHMSHGHGVAVTIIRSRPGPSCDSYPAQVTAVIGGNRRGSSSQSQPYQVTAVRSRLGSSHQSQPAPVTAVRGE